MSAPPFPLPTSVRVVEVGPRDGLQNEKVLIPTEQKYRSAAITLGGRDQRQTRAYAGAFQEVVTNT